MLVELSKDQLEMIKSAVNYKMAKLDMEVTNYRELWSYLLGTEDKKVK